MKIRVAFVIGQYSPEERRLREQVALSYATPIESSELENPMFEVEIGEAT
jgi:hypothetical protein